MPSVFPDWPLTFSVFAQVFLPRRIWQKSLSGTHFEGFKQCKCMMILRDFPYNRALFGEGKKMTHVWYRYILRVHIFWAIAISCFNMLPKFLVLCSETLAFWHYSEGVVSLRDSTRHFKEGHLALKCSHIHPNMIQCFHWFHLRDWPGLVKKIALLG